MRSGWQAEAMTSGGDHEVVPGRQGRLIRRRRRGGAGLGVTEEAALLDLMRTLSPLPVPRVHQVWPSTHTMEIERMPGVALLERGGTLGPARLAEVASDLGRFIAALAAVPVEQVGALLPSDDATHDEYLAEAAATYERHRDAIPLAHRERVERFLKAPAPPDSSTRCVTHHDLGAEHVLVQGAEARITGIIDWSDAAVADPAYDLALVWRDLGTPPFEHALSAFAAAGGEVYEIRPRALFLARAKTLEDLAFGLDHGLESYRANALRALYEFF